MNEITPTEQFNHLAEEITAIIAQRKFSAGMELLEMRHEIGRAILDNPLYEKNKKGQGELLQRVANSVGLGERSLRYCVEFAQKWPSFKKFMEEYGGNHKLPQWREVVRRELPSGKKESVEKETCIHEWVCQKCGAKK
jgi:hypothetical protein